MVLRLMKSIWVLSIVWIVFMAWIFLFHGESSDMKVAFALSSIPSYIGFIISYVVTGTFLLPKQLKENKQ